MPLSLGCAASASSHSLTLFLLDPSIHELQKIFICQLLAILSETQATTWPFCKTPRCGFAASPNTPRPRRGSRATCLRTRCRISAALRGASTRVRVVYQMRERESTNSNQCDSHSLAINTRTTVWASHRETCKIPQHLVFAPYLLTLPVVRPIVRALLSQSSSPSRCPSAAWCSCLP